MTTSTESALTREQIKAMRAADCAVFRWEHNGEQLLTLSKDIERGDGFGRETRHVEIHARAIVTNYGRGWLSSEHGEQHELAPAVKGCWVYNSTKVRSEWVTLAHFVRPGDTLVQEWIVDDRNGAIIELGVTSHQLKVRVERPRPNGRIDVFTFMLDSQTEPERYAYGNVTRQS